MNKKNRVSDPEPWSIRYWMRGAVATSALAALLLWLTAPFTYAGDTASPRGASVDLQAAELINRYIAAWKRFYPSQAFANGDTEAAQRFEDYRPENVPPVARSQRGNPRRGASADGGERAVVAIPG